MTIGIPVSAPCHNPGTLSDPLVLISLEFSRVGLMPA